MGSEMCIRDRVSILYLGFLNESVLVVAIISCRFWLYMGPVVANFFLTFFLATDRLRLPQDGHAGVAARADRAAAAGAAGTIRFQSFDLIFLATRELSL